MFLTQEERDKFAVYCEQQRSDYAAIIEQMRKINLPEPAIRLNEQKAAAYGFVARDLSSAVGETLKG